MTVQTQALKAVAPLLTGADAMAVIKDIVGAVGEWVQIVQTEQTKREAIAAQESLTLAGIAAERDLLLTYLDRSFDERRDNFKQLFAALDHALNNDPALVAELLGSITTLALKSPFADLSDAATVTANLHAKSIEWPV